MNPRLAHRLYDLYPDVQRVTNGRSGGKSAHWLSVLHHVFRSHIPALAAITKVQQDPRPDSVFVVEYPNRPLHVLYHNPNLVDVLEQWLSRRLVIRAGTGQKYGLYLGELKSLRALVDLQVAAYQVLMVHEGTNLVPIHRSGLPRLVPRRCHPGQGPLIISVIDGDMLDARTILF